jgi:ABC-type lipoprotein export system ATPase subunit
VQAAQAALARAQAELELAASKQRRDAELLRKIARERRSAVITVTHDHRMIEGLDTVFHLDDDVLTRQTQASSPA